MSFSSFRINRPQPPNPSTLRAVSTASFPQPLGPPPESQVALTSSPEREISWSPTPPPIADAGRESLLRSLDPRLLPSIESPAPSQAFSTQPLSQRSHTNDTRGQIASASSRGGVRGRRLTEDDEVLLARVCCRHGESWEGQRLDHKFLACCCRFFPG